MICANKNNPLFQELSKNVPSGFITKLLTENPEIKPEEIYSRYIAKLQQLDKGQVELPNVIPLKGNEQLYKDYNLLAKDGKVKVIKEKEASSWLEKLNRSPYYSFAYRKTGLKEGRIFILPKQEPVEETKPGKPEQLTLFAPSEVNYGLKSVEILSSDKAKQIFSKGEKSGWDLNKILTELQIPKPQKEIIIGLGKTKLDDIITNLLANYSYTIEINTAKIKDISQFNQQYNEHTRVFEYNGFEYKADDYYAEESGIVYEKAPLNNLNNTVSITEQEFNQAANNAGFNKTQDIPTQYYSNLTVPGGTNYTENEIATPAITPSIKGHAQFATDKGIGWFRSDEQVSDEEIQKILDEENKKNPNSYVFISKKGKTRRILEVQSDLFQKGRDKKIITKNYLEDRIEYDSNKSKYYYFTVLKGEKAVTTKYFNTLEEAAKNLIKDEQEIINIFENQNQFFQLLNKDNNWVTFFVKSIIQDSAKKGYEKVLFPSGNTASKVEGHTTLEEFKKEKEDRIKKLEENKKTYDERNPNATKEHRQNKIDFYDREINQLKQELARVEKEGFGALKPIYNFYENTVANVLRKQGYNPVLITDEYGNTWNEVTIKPEYLNKILFSKITGAGNKFSNYIPGKKSDSQTVLKQIAQTGGALAAIAKQLLKSGLNIPIEIINVDSFNKDNLPEGVEGFDKSLDDNFQAAGLWSPTERKIFLAKGANVQNTAGILMHEILHGYTNLYIYNNPNSASVKNLDRLLKHLQTEKVQQMLTDKYPLTNLDELLVGIFTNPTFINDLKKLPPTNKNFKSVWEEILQIFRVIFGVTNTSLFDEVFAASSIIVDESMEQMIEQEEYVPSTTLLAAPVSNAQKIVSDRLDSLQTKVIRNPQDNSVVIKDLENIQWIRPSEVAKSKIQKRQFGLKTVEQEEFEKLAQEAGTILHNIQANIIKETFPEYNKHVQKMVIDEGMLGFEQAIRKQLQPIINEAKSRGSILKAEVWIGNLKSQKGGTADLLEITPEGNYYVYDLKTRFTQDVSPLRRFNKINEWSDQTLEYNEILKAGDSELGVVQGKVLGTYILELEVEVKPENKFNYSGSTKYKATNAEKFLKRRELKNIKIVAPTFFLTGDKKIDAMINKLRSQIENMAKKTVSQEQRPAFNQTFESKLDLLQALQLKKDYNKFIQSGYIELAIIRKKLESNDLTDSAFIKEQLELYTNALGLLNPPQEVREQFKKIQGEAQELEIMFEELRKETVVDSANETDVIKRVGFADNLFAAVKDVSWVFSQTMGLADVDNPIVQTVFRKTTVALEKAREKVQQLGDRLMEVSNAYIKATGDKTYSKLIENGHLVDQWKPDFWKEFNAAKNQKNFDWAKDNVTFDEKSYIEARDKQLDFHDSITRDVYANKLKLENPDLDQNEIKRLVEAEIAAQMKKWEASYKNAFTYFTPKTKWTNPKYTEIINGPQEVKEMYLTLKNLLEYANEIIPERVKKNFIPNFQRDYIDKATQLGLLGSIKASWSGFFDSVEVTYDDEMMSQKDAITGEKLGRMWIPGITEIENKSLDLPVVFFKFMEGVYRYEELKSLEDLALTAKDILKKQQWLATDMLGNAISVDKTPSRPNPASRTLAMMEGWVDQVFYNKSLQKDVAVEIKGNGFTELIGILKKGDKKMLSIGKMVDKVIHWTTLKNLGFSLYSPMVNLLGGSANMYMTGANGLYYSKSDLNKAMALALAGKTNLPNEDAKKARLILDWLNINAGEFIKKQEDLLSNSITKKLMADYNALALMRESENVLRDAGALAVVLGGKYEFNWDSFKVVDGKLVVEANDFQKSKFKQQIIKINRKNIGGISEDDMMLAKQQIVGRMLMQHRSWLPALFYERFGGKKYDWVLDKDIEGRYVTAFRLFKHLIGLSKITQLSEMEQANLKSTRIELALIIGIGILRSLLKSGLDDEDKKEAWYKISDKISDRVTGELVFFVDPTFESQYQILLSPAPVLGTAGDVGKFIGSLYKADDEDKRTKGPLQRAIKLTPLSKVDAFLTDLGLNPIDEK